MYGVQSTRRNCSFFGAASTATVKAATSNIPSKCIYPGRRIDRINFALGWLFIILSLSADHFTAFKAFITGIPEPRFFVQLRMLSQHILRRSKLQSSIVVELHPLSEAWHSSKCVHAIDRTDRMHRVHAFC